MCMAQQLQVVCSTAGWVEACRSIAGLHPSCSLRLRPHPRQGLARLQSGLQPHRPGVLCSGLRPAAAAAAGCSRDCCTTLLLRLHCAAAAAAALCCMRGFTARTAAPASSGSLQPVSDSAAPGKRCSHQEAGTPHQLQLLGRDIGYCWLFGWKIWLCPATIFAPVLFQ